jgi:hypothetical protein
MAIRLNPFGGRLLAMATVLALAGCAGSSAVPEPASSSAAPAFGTGSGGGASGCALPIAEYEAVIDADRQTGNVNTLVYRRIIADLQPVKASCAAGQTAAANSRLAAVKSRHGYR